MTVTTPEVCTPNSFIHLFYNSPDMDVVDMYNILIIPRILSFGRRQCLLSDPSLVSLIRGMHGRGAWWVAGHACEGHAWQGVVQGFWCLSKSLLVS